MLYEKRFRKMAVSYRRFRVPRLGLTELCATSSLSETFAARESASRVG
jgi:hypothetical protein